MGMHQERFGSSAADFSLLCKDGAEIQVNFHLLSKRSKIFLSGPKQGDDKRIDMTDFSREAVQKFIRFLNGSELDDEEEEEKDWKNDLAFIKELIVLGELYDASDCQ